MENYNFNTINYNDDLFFPRDTSTFLVKGTQIQATNAWTGELPAGIDDYKDGLTIDYFLPQNSTMAEVTLSLGGLDGKPVYQGNTTNPVTNQFPQYSVVRLTYIVHSALNSGNGCWKATAVYYDNNLNGTVRLVSGEKGLTGSVTTEGALKANLVSETLLSNPSVATTEDANRIYPVALDKNGKLAVNVPWTNVNSNYLTSHQTIKQDGIIGPEMSHYAVCNTASSVASKNVTLNLGGNSLESGLRIIVQFNYVNTADNPKINLNNTGDVAIYFNNSQITTGETKSLLSGTLELVLDNISGNTGWRIVGTPIKLINLVDGSATGSVRGIGTSAESSSYTIGQYAFAEGTLTIAEGSSSHAEGSSTEAYGNASHTEGEFTYAMGLASHAEGTDTAATDVASHAEGESTTASGYAAHSEGYNTAARGDYSHAQNCGTIAQRKSQTVFGEYNVADTEGTAGTRGKYVVIVGNGTASNACSNALTIDWSGNTEQQGTATVKDMTSLEMMEFIYDI